MNQQIGSISAQQIKPYSFSAVVAPDNSRPVGRACSETFADVRFRFIIKSLMHLMKMLSSRTNKALAARRFKGSLRTKSQSNKNRAGK